MYKGQWYVGVKIIHTQYYHADIFQTRDEPTYKTHGDKYLFVWGGYKTKRKAIEVAMYQNYYIDN